MQSVSHNMDAVTPEEYVITWIFHLLCLRSEPQSVSMQSILEGESSLL